MSSRDVKPCPWVNSPFPYRAQHLPVSNGPKTVGCAYRCCPVQPAHRPGNPIDVCHQRPPAYKRDQPSGLETLASFVLRVLLRWLVAPIRFPGTVHVIHGWKGRPALTKVLAQRLTDKYLIHGHWPSVVHRNAVEPVPENKCDVWHLWGGPPQNARTIT